MALRNILTDSDPKLRKVCRPVGEVTDRIRTLLDDMAETMYAADGVGLAAPQVGVCRRVVVVDAGDGLYEFIDPVIIESEGDQCGMEACLSLPEVTGYVTRPKRVVIRATDRNGKVQDYEASGFKAVAFCHELDHLDGVLFSDRVIENPTEEQIRQNDERLKEVEALQGHAAQDKPMPRGRRNTRVVKIRKED